MTLAFSFGKWGGVYVEWGWSKRLCLGWVAITFFPVDLDDMMWVMRSKNTSYTPQNKSDG